MPTKSVTGTTIFNSHASEQIVGLIRKSAPRAAMTIRTSTGTSGVDVEFRVEDVPATGFQYAQIKPMTEYGYRSFCAQIARRKFPAAVLAVTYDDEGNIYYGFSKIGKHTRGTEVLSQNAARATDETPNRKRSTWSRLMSNLKARPRGST
jgi:hypothetical protein